MLPCICEDRDEAHTHRLDCPVRFGLCGHDELGRWWEEEDR